MMFISAASAIEQCAPPALSSLHVEDTTGELIAECYNYVTHLLSALS